MKQNFKLLIEYDGTPFFGWQKQETQKTVQGEIERVLTRILNQDIKISGSGRTDAGVHALGQVASFHAQTQIRPADLKTSLNSMFKEPIVIRACEIVDNAFHAQYSAVSKVYQYVILNREDPAAIGRRYHWHIRNPLDVDQMNHCCQLLTGTHDFKSFENTGSPRTSTVREVFFSRMNRFSDHRIIFEICASGFLKNMVRNIVGTLVYVGRGKFSVHEFKTILEAADRSKAGPTAPPQGLFLKTVNYL